MARAPVVCPRGASCAEAISRLNESRAGLAVVVDATGAAIGIVTDQDVSRRVVFQLPPDTPVERIMTAPAPSIGGDDYLFRAIGLMWRQGLDRLVVTDAAGRPAGMLALRQAVAPALAPLLRNFDGLTAEGEADGLHAAKAAQIGLAGDLLGDGVPAPAIQGLISDLDHDLYRRAVAANVEALALNGWGPPPVGFRVIVMGSSGRGESFLHADQDNGFLLDPYPDDRHSPIDAYFTALAEGMTRDLDAAGLSLCRGDVMATNPIWRKTLPQWQHQVAIWARRHPTALLQANIFLDFAEIGGPSAGGRALRRRTLDVLRSSPGFLRDMVEVNGQFGSGVGWFGRFTTASHDGPYRGKTDLKTSGLQPIVASVRLYALREAVEATATLERIDALHEAGVFEAGERDDLAGAYDAIAGLLLRQQIRDARAGAPVTSHVDPDALPRRDREALLDALRVADALSARARKDLAAPIPGFT